MRTIRRLYFYLITLISIEVIIWGVISLTRTLFSKGADTDTVYLLATGLSLLIVGLPIFLLHWIITQRDAQKDSEEKSTRLRAIFLYATRIGTLIPAATNLLAIINRLFLTLFNQSGREAFIGSGQSYIDNILAILINLVAWYYFNRVLEQDWKTIVKNNNLKDTRRLYRYIWVIYGLVLLIAGAQQIMQYLFGVMADYEYISMVWAPNGIALLIIGAPIWYVTWQLIQKSLGSSEESTSTLRLIFLYLATLAGLAPTIIAVVTLLESILGWIFGLPTTFALLLTNNTQTLSIGIPMAVVWIFHNRHFHSFITQLPDSSKSPGLKRLLEYILSLAGTVITYLSIYQLFDTLIIILFQDTPGDTFIKEQLSLALALLTIGLILWLRSWRKMQVEVLQDDDYGDHARRSIIRKGYLYLILFLTVIGCMTAAGLIFYLLFTTLFEGAEPDFGISMTRHLVTFFLTLLWLAYHFQTQRVDNKAAQRSIAKRYASYPVLVLQPSGSDLLTPLQKAFNRYAPEIPLTVHTSMEEPPGEEASQSKAVILPADQAVNPSKPIRKWLATYKGKRIFIPLHIDNWIWLDTGSQTTDDLAVMAAQTAAALAEGQQIHKTSRTNPWVIVGYIAGGIFAVTTLFSILMNLLT